MKNWKEGTIMEKELNMEIVNGVKKIERENSLWGWLMEKRLYRTDEVCTLLRLPYHFWKW